MPKKWIATALAVLALGACLLAIAGVGLWTYMGRTAEILHPDAAQVPSVARTPVAARWDDVAMQARRLVRTALSAQNLPGLSVAVGVDREVVWAEGFGWANVETRSRLTPETAVKIGTASTILTSAAVGLLVEDGRLSLDDEIHTRVPAFPLKPWPVTLRQVMAHTAGVRSDGGDESPLLSGRCKRPVDAFHYFAERELLFQPGTEFRWSRYGWIVVSAAVEAATGEPFLRFMRKRVFEPAGMDDTRPSDPTAPNAEDATSYFPRFSADPRYGLDLMGDVDLSCYSGGGVFVSTPSDLVRFALAVAHGDLLRPETVRTLQISQRLDSGAATGYGLGWDLETMMIGTDQVTTVGHDGDVLGGPVASLLSLPEDGLVVAVLSNSAYADTRGLASAVATTFLPTARRDTPASSALPAPNGR